MKIGWATTTNTFQLVVVVLVIYFIAIAKCQMTTENLQLIQDEFCSKNVNHTFCLHLVSFLLSVANFFQKRPQFCKSQLQKMKPFSKEISKNAILNTK